MEAADHDCLDGLQLSQEGYVCECSSASLFWIKDEILFTPSLTTGCLAGTTREIILELSPVAYQEVQAPIDTLQEADAVFITNVNWQVLAIDALLPNNWQWNSKAWTTRFQSLLLDDIVQYIRKYHA
jgi:4-amino-4-deoxychorismate lyase